MENLRTSTLATRKKTILILFFIIFTYLNSYSYSQPSIKWQWLYPGPYDDDDIGMDICESTDGNYYLIGTSSGFNYFPNYYVIKIDQQGGVIWSRALGGTSGMGYAFAVAPASDGGCVVTGGAARFLKFNASGDTLVNKFLSGQERRLFDIKRTADNYYIACGRYNLNNGTVIKFDENGNVFWERVFLSPYVKQLNSVEEGIDGGYIAVGRSQNSFNDPIKLLIVKLTPTGDSLWTKEYGDNLSGVEINKFNSNYIITGQHNINKIDVNGYMYDSFSIDSINLSEQVKDFKILSPNRFVYASTDYRHADTIYSKILLSDSSGNIIRVKKINFSNYIDLNKMQLCPNNDIIFMGYGAQTNTSSKALFYALRTDTTFNFPPVSVIGIQQISNELPGEFRLFQNYPNPFNGSTIIEFDAISKGSYTFEIHNLLGQKVFEQFYNLSGPGKYKINLNISDLSSGIYFYSLISGYNRFTRKLIFIK